MATDSLKDKSLIFLQMTRTAGLAICSALQEEFGLEVFFKLGTTLPGEKNGYKEFKEAAARNTFSVYAGHFFFGAHMHVPKPCEYVTSLRNPVEQLLSRYEATCRNLKKKIDVVEWLAADFESHNGMVKRLCGIGAEHHSLPPYDFVNEQPVSPDMEAGEAEYELALQNIEKHFSCVMLHGYFEENMTILQHHYGTGPLFSLNRQFINHAMAPIKRENYLPEIIDQIIAQNEYDIRLFENFRDKYIKELDEKGDAFKEDVRILKLISAILSDVNTQSIETDVAIKRLIMTLNQLVTKGCQKDAVRILRSFTPKFYVSVDFCRFALQFIGTHGSPAELASEIKIFKNRFPDEPPEA
ncbi:MAG: hypothetical protein OQJ97_16420 [Rhodospirillales bacterium]|nr:hypothetical protein [Rhodospirillales bacterium]